MRKNLLIFSLWFPATIITLIAAIILLYIMPVSVIEKSIIPSQNQSLGVNEYQLYAAVPEVLGTFTSTITTGDARPGILTKFFETHKSPLIDYSNLLVEVADTYNLDFRLLPAIAMQESNLCKRIPAESYNCWGFGIYGSKVLRFESYEEAIETIAKTLRGKYVDKGLLTPEEIQAKYTPSSNGSWAASVSHFMDLMK